MSYSNSKPKFVNPFNLFVKMSRLIEEVEKDDRELERQLKGEGLPESILLAVASTTSVGTDHSRRHKPAKSYSSQKRRIRWSDQVGRPIEESMT